MSGIEVVGLALAVIGTADICLKVEVFWRNAQLSGADTEIDKRVLQVKSHWKHTIIQLEFIMRIWATLDEEHQNIQEEVLQNLHAKLLLATTKLEKLAKKRLTTQPAKPRLTERWRWKYLQVKKSLDRTIEDLASWQALYDPSWFLILKLSDSLIDRELLADDHRPLFSSIRDLRSAIKEEHSQRSIFLPNDGVDMRTVWVVPFASSRLVQRSNSEKWVLLDSVPHKIDIDMDLQIRDIRNLARKLSYVEPLKFGILQCRGVIKSSSSFEFAFQIPPVFSSRPTSLRSCVSSHPNHSISSRLRLAIQLARSVSFVHTLGLVHKNIRPETVLVLGDDNSTLGQSFLTGFQEVRMADGGTRRLGDDVWDLNLYRHPHRQGSNIEESYVMQHDIYSLGVCLLEIGIWESLVCYKEDTIETTPATILESNKYNTLILMKENLVALAKRILPFRMGDLYEEVVLNCLTCMDQSNVDFGDPTEFQDNDGILVGVKYIEKILLTLGKILV